MKTPRNRITKFTVLGLSLVLAATVHAAAQQITTTLDNSSIALGDSAQLTVTVSGNDTSPPELPAVNGLDFTPVGQSSSFQSINGAVTSSVSYTYQVMPNRAGSFTIPAIRLPDGASSQPVMFRVTNNAGGAASMPPANLPEPNISSSATDNGVTANGQMAFLRVVMPKHELYVGQMVPVQVRAYFRAGMAASLNGLPTLSSDALTMNKLDANPQQQQEIIGGQPYTVVTWSSAIAAVKAGDYSVNLLLPVTVQEMRRGHHENPFKQFFGNNSPFDDSFFNDSAFDDFFGNVVEKSVTLQTGAADVKVLPLPVAGRPANFSGAVGQFEVSSEAVPTQLTVGDPITLRLKVSGEGNFERVYSSGLDLSGEWKTYSPSAKFDPADSVGFNGTKTFEQAVIPLKAGSGKIPALAFSYFDPDTRQYMTRTTTPIAITVAPGSGAPTVASTPANSAAIAPSAANSTTSELAPNKVEAGTFVSSLQPVLFKPWFIVSQSVPVMALAAAFFVQKRRRLAQDPRRQLDRAAQAAVREQLAAMDQALAAQNAPDFFNAARQAVQKELARRWQLPTSQVTSAEIARRMNGDAGELRNLFAVADDVVYSGQRVPPSELQRWKDTVMQQLKNWRSHEHSKHS